uniref:Amino acid transporter transmembrane domain-containing protein n=1 Tax=Kalanchoe fedtschenkoi TaxID=63787 RepID=A0A7N0TPM3_KALFE
MNNTKNPDSRVFAVERDGSSVLLDDDGRPKRTGSVMTATAHIITTVIGSGVLALGWATAQLGWVGGPLGLVAFSLITVLASYMLSSCYRTGDLDNGKRNPTYMDAVRSFLGGWKVKFCGLVQYGQLCGAGVGYTIASSLSMLAVQKSSCLHRNGGASGEASCKMNSNPYMIAFGVAQIFLSQIPGFTELWWLSYVAAVMSFTYSSIGVAIGFVKVAENGWKIKGNLTGVPIGTITKGQKVLRTFQSMGNIAFAYSFSMILLEIQDTIKCPPSESKTMKRAAFASVIVTTVFYMLCGCSAYAAFGIMTPGNLLTGFGYFNPYWVLDIANIAIVVHLVGAYQVYVQPFFAFIEKRAANSFPNSALVTKEFAIPMPGSKQPYKLSLLRLVWRTFFVFCTTLTAMILPFFKDVSGLLGAIAFWPLTVFFPIEMFVVQMKIRRWSAKWVALQTLSLICLCISLLAASGAIYSISKSLKVYRPFRANH